MWSEQEDKQSVLQTGALVRLMHFDISLACFAQTGNFVIGTHFKQRTCYPYNSYNSTFENTDHVELNYFLNRDLGVKEKWDSIMVHAIIQHVEMSLYCMILIGFPYWRWWCSLLKSAGLTSPTHVMN